MSYIGSEYKTRMGGIVSVVKPSSGRVGRSVVYLCKCSICSKDEELFPDYFESTISKLKMGGCCNA